MDVIVDALRRLELFAPLTPLQLTEIVRNADRVTFNPGDTILMVGEECDAATVVVSGDAVCLRNEKHASAEEPVEAGSILAELAMVVDIEATATVVAKTRVRAIRITRSAMLTLFQDEPEIAEVFLDEITSRLRNVANNLRLIEDGFDLPVDTSDAQQSTGLSASTFETMPTPPFH